MTEVSRTRKDGQLDGRFLPRIYKPNLSGRIFVSKYSRVEVHGHVYESLAAVQKAYCLSLHAVRGRLANRREGWVVL